MKLTRLLTFAAVGMAIVSLFSTRKGKAIREEMLYKSKGWKRKLDNFVKKQDHVGAPANG